MSAVFFVAWCLINSVFRSTEAMSRLLFSTLGRQVTDRITAFS